LSDSAFAIIASRTIERRLLVQSGLHLAIRKVLVRQIPILKHVKPL
jgi:hypothetical protein